MEAAAWQPRAPPSTPTQRCLAAPDPSRRVAPESRRECSKDNMHASRSARGGTWRVLVGDVKNTRRRRRKCSRRKHGIVVLRCVAVELEHSTSSRLPRGRKECMRADLRVDVPGKCSSWPSRTPDDDDAPGGSTASSSSDSSRSESSERRTPPLPMPRAASIISQWTHGRVCGE